METIDYKKYSLEELLEIKTAINADEYPDNYNALLKELESREEFQEKQIQQKQTKEAEYSLAEKRVKIIGYFQIASAVGIAGLLFMGLFSDDRPNSLGLIISVILVCLNLSAGYTAIKEQYKWYWLSIINQSLQVPSFAIGSIVANYSGLGGVYCVFYWGEVSGINFAADFDPGFSFVHLSEALHGGSISIDILAVIFVSALVTVKQTKLDAKSSLLHKPVE